MTYGYDEFENDDNEQNGPKALRDALKKAQDDLKARDAKIAELEQTNATLTTQVKSSTLRDAFQDAGIDPKYARFAERDEVEASKDAVEKWAEENREVYAFLAKSTPAQPSDDEQEGDDFVEDEIPDELRDGVTAGQALESTGRPSGSRKLEEVFSNADWSSFKSEAELDAFLRSGGQG